MQNQGSNFLITMMLNKEAPAGISQESIDQLAHIYTTSPIEELQAEETKLNNENPNSLSAILLGRAIRIRKNDSQREF